MKTIEEQKKDYKQPLVTVVDIATTGILCVSGQYSVEEPDPIEDGN